MQEAFKVFAHTTGRSLEVLGISAIVLGVLASTIVLVLDIRTHDPFEKIYRRYRKHVGAAILLGLELLVAADIVRTLSIDLGFSSVGVLAAVVAIRTFLSFSLELEVSGHWPWQATPDSRGRSLDERDPNVVASLKQSLPQ